MGVFLLLLIGFAVGLWGTVIRPPAYEVRGVVVARPAANLLLLRHEDIPALGMKAMELMAVFGDPDAIDKAGAVPGQRLRLGVRQKDDQLTLMWAERLP